MPSTQSAGRPPAITLQSATPRHLTFGLVDGRIQPARVTKWNPRDQDVALDVGKGEVILVAVERIAWVGTHGQGLPQTARSESQPPPAGSQRLKLHVSGGRTFVVDIDAGEDPASFGFRATPVGKTLYKELYFYGHGVVRREDATPIGEMLVRSGHTDPASLSLGLAAQVAARKQTIGQILVEQRKVEPQAVEEAALLQNRRKMRIGEVLVEAGLATEKDIEVALAEQKKRGGKKLGEMLVELGVVREVDMTATLARKFYLPFVDLDTCHINPAALDQVPREILEKHPILPLDFDAATVTLALPDPMVVDAVDLVRFHSKKRVLEVLVAPSQLARIKAEMLAASAKAAAAGSIHDVGSILHDLEVSEKKLVALAPSEDDEDAPAAESTGIIALVNRIIEDAHARGASDIHIEPNGGDGPTVIRLRVDGDCAVYAKIPASFRSAVVARVKILAKLDISERRKPQDGKIRHRLPDGGILELRVATLPTVNGNEDVVARLLASSKPLPLDRMNMSARNLVELRKLAAKPYGLVLCVGPTGSGKTTTLHSVLSSINTEDMKIWTAEDPVEITQPGLRQVQVHAKIGFTFAQAMRAFLRADPDVIMVGEMRDLETAGTAVEASLTGHLVLSTLHTNSAPETITRLLDMGLDPFSFSDALLGVLAQRLTRALCKDCRESYIGTSAEYQELSELYGPEAFVAQFGPHGPGFRLHRAKGCSACKQSGYKGRLPLHELLVVSDEVRRAVARKEPVEAVRQAAIKGGMTTLAQDGIAKCLAGDTDMTQVLAVCSR